MDRPSRFVAPLRRTSNVSHAAALLALGCVGLIAFGCSNDRPGKYPDDRDPPRTPCEQTNVCRIWGWCAEVDGECRPTTNEHCRGSVACQKGGLCTLEPYVSKCIARGDDCTGSTWCEVYDMCDAREGVCK